MNMQVHVLSNVTIFIHYTALHDYNFLSSHDFFETSPTFVKTTLKKTHPVHVIKYMIINIYSVHTRTYKN